MNTPHDFSQNPFVAQIFSLFYRTAINLRSQNPKPTETKSKTEKLIEEELDNQNYVLMALERAIPALKIKATFVDNIEERKSLIKDADFISDVIASYRLLEKEHLEVFQGIYNLDSTTDILGTINSAKLAASL